MQESTLKRLNGFLQKYGVWIIILISAIVSVLATIHYFDAHKILAYNDARSRLNIARRVTDSKTPGIVQLGTIWLPLQQLLMIPFAAVYRLWRNGLSGSIVSMFAYVITSVFVYKTLFLITKKFWLGFLASLLFMLNLNVLYLQSTAMTEILLLATVIASIYSLTKWLMYKQNITLAQTGLWLFLATLVRYEGWVLLALSSLIVFTETRYFDKQKSKSSGRTILLASIGFFGIFLWLLWNLVFFGSPLYFITGANGQFALTGHGGPIRHHFVLTLTTYWRAIALNIDNIVAITAAVAVVGLVVYSISRRKRLYTYLALLLLAPAMLNLLTLYSGTTIIFTTLSGMRDTRYAISSILIASIFIPLALSKLKPIIAIIAGLIILASSVSVFPSAYLSALRSQSIDPQGVAFIDNFSKIYNGGNILATSTNSYAAIEQTLGYRLKNYISEGSYHYWQPALAMPQKYVKYVFMYTVSSGDQVNDPVYGQYVHHRTLYDKYFITIYKNSKYQALELRSALKKPVPNTSAIFEQGSKSNTNIAKQSIPQSMLSDALSIKVAVGDSLSTIVRAQIRVIDNQHALSATQEAYVEGTEVTTLGSANLIYPGQIVTISRTQLQNLIRNAEQMTAAQLSGWQVYGASIDY